MEQTDEQEKLTELVQRRGRSVRLKTSTKTPSVQPENALLSKLVKQTSKKDAPFGKSLMVMEFSESAPMEAIHWIVEKMRKRRVDGGMELIVRKEELRKESQSITFHIFGNAISLQIIAHEMGLMKRTKTGIMRKFNLECLNDFFDDLAEGIYVKDILTVTEQQIIVKYALDMIRATDDEKKIPGTTIILYHGQSIVQAAQIGGLISSLYSLHEKGRLKELFHRWKKPTAPQPIDEIRDYFGESIGMYFSFLGFYTCALAVPTFLGIVQFDLSEKPVPFFLLFYVVWMKVFLELWKRKSSSHAYHWGTIKMTNLDEPRVGYCGELARDPITGKWTPHYPKWKTYAQMCCVSAPIIGLCMAFAGVVIWCQIGVEAYLAKKFGQDTYILYLPSVVNAILIAGLTPACNRLATLLTDYENHRTQSQYERHRVNKLIVLEFINNFLGLFYIAFVLQKKGILKKQLYMQLSVLVLQNVFENFYTYLKKKVGNSRMVVTSKYDKLKEAHDALEELGILSLPEDDPRVLQARKETILQEYDTYDGYLKLYIMFGYVVLFSSVTPLIAFWPLCYNVFKIRFDAYKLCSFFKRPFACRTKNIGAWQLAFEILVVVSIFTNCGILYISPQMRELGAGMSRDTYTCTFVIIEHVLLGLTWFICKVIPDTPYSVRVALAKEEHDSRQALQTRSLLLSGNVLFRRFRSVYDTHSMLN
ncbi:anoctamin-10-like [Anopheles cruzii]|uniref:anoctamin-10-like n=1 Tax=Anopheles cruzii TaxID=68878 RepID=UPI0022EC8D92|nr:anoctamin-10-like [Anopheles cruzii]